MNTNHKKKRNKKEKKKSKNLTHVRIMIQKHVSTRNNAHNKMQSIAKQSDQNSTRNRKNTSKNPRESTRPRKVGANKKAKKKVEIQRM